MKIVFNYKNYIKKKGAELRPEVQVGTSRTGCPLKRTGEYS